MNQKHRITTKFIFVKAIPVEVTSEILRRYFSQFGLVKSARIAKKKGVLNKSTGLVRMDSKRGVQRALQQDIHVLSGSVVQIEPRLTGDELILKNEALAAKRIYVSGIPPSMTNKSFTHLFSKYGAIEVAYLDRVDSSDNLSRNYGFVTFTLEETVKQLIEKQSVSYQNYALDIRPFRKKSTKLTYKNLRKSSKENSTEKTWNKLDNQSKIKKSRKNKGNNRKPSHQKRRHKNTIFVNPHNMMYHCIPNNTEGLIYLGARFQNRELLKNIHNHHLKGKGNLRFNINDKITPLTFD